MNATVNRFVRNILLWVCCLLTIAAFEAYGQRDKEPKTATTRPANTTALQHQQVYALAMRYRDYPTAIQALYYQLIEEPNNMALKDSLASLYFMSAQSLQALTVGLEVLEAEPKNTKILEMVAIIYSGQNVKKSLEYYERLYELSQQPYHLYQICALQYGLKRESELMDNLQRLINHPETATKTVNIQLSEREGQDVKIKAAAYNVLGMVHLEKGDKPSAEQAFQQALTIEPNFTLPKNNLEQMKKK
jgi:tetratricopeptide (TPR) repeat protein